jgi:cytochrome c oxidase assembly protein subunit 15
MEVTFRSLVYATTALAFVVVAVGAFVRLSDAGLGCPDWPGCYGQVTPAHAEEEIARAVGDQGGGEHGPVSLRKAWKEMAHRYLAGTLGLLILSIAILAWRQRGVLRQSPALPGALVGIVMLQAALGMWTVTLLLKPVVVTLHLLGGMATFALLAWLALRQHALSDGGDASSAAARRLQPWALGGLAILVLQIALGGWVSSNYAALACIDFPTCHGVWRPDMDFRHGFQLVRELGRTAAGEHLAYEALTAIHWTHRVGALVTFLYLGALALALARTRSLGGYAAALAVALTVQVGLGIANVLGGVPLATAVTHNAVAAILLALLVMINFALSRRSFTPH